ncbi:helix-turn-helix domain-containing protein [Microlunatus capsulatus]|uniref:AraC-like DNA-binding protein n=1 Tax=Microlunatus capsulatus TaxID=99117 RepID=A0ABS4ZDL2_9ACTN|nr:AraC family transcriptional regulator [Microlunatus capsulatus]MBP2419119.1 AraC-like DNA-binding protein [Microlunatus capsulatus]
MTVPVPLGGQPQVVSLGLGVHGQRSHRDRFLLPDLWAFHLYRYRAALVLDGVEHALLPGSVSLVPPGTVTVYRYRGVSEHLYVHLRLSGEPVGLPPVAHAGASVPLLTDLLTTAVTTFPLAPAAATASVWAALWQVAGLVRPSVEDPARARIAPVLAAVESSLTGPLPVGELAALAGVSPAHLTRLFRAATGRTVVGYVRHRRGVRAEHLLRRTTLPVATIARSVGVPDLQAFNKLCHDVLGASPRAVRAGDVATVTG